MVRHRSGRGSRRPDQDEIDQAGLAGTSAGDPGGIIDVVRN
jgi:hypothetical protein